MGCSFVLEEKYKNYKHIAGVDEAGRGALAGPVVSAVVILNKKTMDPRINDSKKISPLLRQELADFIKKNSLAWALGIVDNTVIDAINILQATLLAAYEALEKITIKPDFLLTDYLKLPKSNIPFLALKKGDSISYSIAAASILAKVTRDEIMQKYHDKYQDYDFINNKGYPVKKHYKAIEEKGITSIHRKSFSLYLKSKK